ncbi:MAG: hypothetical protein ABIV94_09995 [Acidimicrobiales bacterium]
MRRALSSAAVAVVLLAGCSGGSSRASSSGSSDSSSTSSTTASSVVTTTTSTTTTTAVAAPEQLALAAYRHGWDVLFQSLNPPDPLAAPIVEAFTGAALQDTVNIINDTRGRGEYVTGTIALHPNVVDVTADTVTMTDCTVETSTTFDAATGGAKETGPYPPRNRNITVSLVASTWKVAVIDPVEDPCTPA